MKRIKARLLIRKREQYALTKFSEAVIWKPTEPVEGCGHLYKYRLAYVVNQRFVVRYDNEARKGDHRHYGDMQARYSFHSLEQLINDFHTDIARWDHENHHI